jgi:hypothetical protein
MNNQVLTKHAAAASGALQKLNLCHVTLFPEIEAPCKLPNQPPSCEPSVTIDRSAASAVTQNLNPIAINLTDSTAVQLY